MNDSYEFIKAVDKGDLELINEFLEQGKVQPTENDNLALSRAMMHKQSAAAERLLQVPSIRENAHTPGFVINLPLTLAVREGLTNIVKLLLEIPSVRENAHIPGKYGSRNTPLVLAARDGRVEIAKMLLEIPAVRETANGDSLPLVLATKKGFTEIIKMLSNTSNIEENQKLDCENDNKSSEEGKHKEDNKSNNEENQKLDQKKENPSLLFKKAIDQIKKPKPIKKAPIKKSKPSRTCPSLIDFGNIAYKELCIAFRSTTAIVDIATREFADLLGTPSSQNTKVGTSRRKAP